MTIFRYSMQFKSLIRRVCGNRQAFLLNFNAAGKFAPHCALFFTIFIPSVRDRKKSHTFICTSGVFIGVGTFINLCAHRELF